MSSPALPASKKHAGKYLTVVLEAEAYGIPVLKVREIIRLQNITHVPQLPNFVKGVINLRGRVIPIVDLRLKFGLAAHVAERSCIVVVQVKIGEDRLTQMGLIVDGVEEVASIADDDIEPTPDFGTLVDTRYLLGMAKVKGQVKHLLDIDCVVAPETVRALVQA